MPPPHVAADAAPPGARDAEVDHLRARLAEALHLVRIGEVGGVLVHELNQPLLVLGGHIDMHREGLIRPGAEGEAWEVMGRATGRVAGLVRTLHTASRTRVLHRDRVDLAEVVALALLQTGRPERIRVSGAAPPVYGSAVRLALALGALLDNALRFSDGVVEVGLEGRDGEARITVADRGPGIPEARRPTLFKPWSGGATPAGLGLAIVERVMKDHEGTVAYADRPGGGAELCLTLPEAAP